MEIIISLILTIAAETGVPPYFALSIAFEENRELNPLTVNTNENGTFDRGIMQLNSGWHDGDWKDPETNVRAGCLHIKSLMEKPELNTYWAVAVAYNCGYWKFVSAEGPPMFSVDYGGRVMDRWHELTGVKYIDPVLRKSK
jgi:soluble lytic murein transglycosylase-like protein